MTPWLDATAHMEASGHQLKDSAKLRQESVCARVSLEEIGEMKNTIEMQKGSATVECQKMDRDQKFVATEKDS